MNLRLYNTLSRTKENFSPLDPANVRLYVCGPTVYDRAHIGNARPLIVFDILYRLLRHLYGADHVAYVRNITDVDDKINARAAERGVSIRELTGETVRVFHEDVAALGCLAPNVEPRATDHIEEMKSMIEALAARSIAYVADDHVLFSVAAMDARGKLPRYGSLSRRSADELIAGARVEVASYKREPTDFVLWKPSNAGEPAWDSPCGIERPGRPGWHIECSAMSYKHLIEAFAGRIACQPLDANAFDIHGGGLDLIFPHHENEIAQTCCALDTPRMAQIWMHNGFLQVEGRKMAKSAGNFVTIRDLLTKHQGEVVRFTMLKSQYRQPIDFRMAGLEESAQELAQWASLIANSDREEMAGDALGERDVPEALLAPLLDDLNTPDAVTALRVLFDKAKTRRSEVGAFWRSCRFLGLLDRAKYGALLPGAATGPELWARYKSEIEDLKAAHANGFSQAIESGRGFLRSHGVDVDFRVDGYPVVSTSEDDDAVKRLIDRRSAARAAKNWAESDRIRDELASMGVTLKDDKDGATTWELKR